MRLKDMFTVPKGQKVTEKQLLRVLTASICTIALCMTCLAGTTWALFSVSIENTGNEIQIGNPAVAVTVNGQKFTSGAALKADDCTVSITHGNAEDVFQQKSTLYVTLTIQTGEKAISRYVTLMHENGYQTALTIRGGADSLLSWEVSWFAPVGAVELIDSVIEVTEVDPETPDASEGEETPEESTGATEGPSEGATDPSVPEDSQPDPSEGGSEPVEPDPSEESSEPTESVPDPSEESGTPTESIPDSSEVSPEPTESIPDSGTESSEPKESDPVEPVMEPAEQEKESPDATTT